MSRKAKGILWNGVFSPPNGEIKRIMVNMDIRLKRKHSPTCTFCNHSIVKLIRMFFHPIEGENACIGEKN